MSRDHTKNIMHLLLSIMILGICWLLLVEIPGGASLEIIDLLAWLIMIFIIPLTLMNFNDEAPWFTGGSLLYAIIYSILSIAQMLKLADRSCCHIEGFVISSVSMLVCLAIIVLATRDLVRYRRRYSFDDQP